MSFKEFFDDVKNRVNTKLQEKIESLDTDALDLKEAMSYGLMLGGKRSRPFLVYATAKALNIDFDKVDNAACAVECIHAYSLIHDDMPEMDNDELRRGMPSVHKKFGSALALLAGDALQTLAFECLASSSDAKIALLMLKILASNAGYSGMCGGQAIDLASEGKSINLDELVLLHSKKTGALICASVLMSASFIKDSDIKSYEALHTYAKKVGVAFQIQDDLLDILGDTKIIGKKVGSDASLNKSTYPSLLGIEQSQRLAIQTVDEALEALQIVNGDTSLLSDFAQFCIKRDH